MAIRHRNDSRFFRREHGAEVGDMFLSFIHTAERRGDNPSSIRPPHYQLDGVYARDPQHGALVFHELPEPRARAATNDVQVRSCRQADSRPPPCSTQRPEEEIKTMGHPSN